MNEPELEELYDQHVWTVFGFIGNRTASRELAEDLTQQTFERALRSWHRFDPERGSAKTWLLSIARNLVIDSYRAEGPAASDLDQAEQAGEGALQVPAEEPPLGPSPELARALRRLSARDRELLALRYGADMTGAEIAETTGLKLANVQQILSRALRRLRAELGPDVEAPGQRGEG